MGRRIERSLQTVELLGSLPLPGDPEDDGRLILLLDIADSFMTYRSRYLLTPQLAPVLDLLLFDETNPRSVAFQLAALVGHLGRLPHDAAEPEDRSEYRVAAGMLESLRKADATDLCRRGAGGDRPALEALLERILADLPDVTVDITRHYFSHAEGFASFPSAFTAPR
jgi:uncharacterized alpha-E superfamily protein